ncbi:MAG: PadR family transcriptional regulator [Oceanicaulis sp.]|nr:PadR family transcriptional regulator [Oceanicaulis sp.]
MSLRHAVLGILAQKPVTGFELLSEFDISRSVIWPAPQNEVYRVLRVLKQEGLAREVARGARGSRTYAITDAGREALRAWLMAPSDYSLRYEPMLKAVFLSEVGGEDRRERAKADLAFFEEQLAILKIRGEAVQRSPDAPGKRVDAWRMAISFYQAMAEWARAAAAGDR